jgi:hypothetical protein
MYSREEAAKIRKEFWMAFDVYSRKYLGPKRKWLLYDTGIKDFVLKFDINRDYATVMLAVENRSEDKRFDTFVKLKEYELLYADILGDGWIWEEQYRSESGKDVCALYTRLDGVNIYKKENWTQIFDFFGINMLRLEETYEEVKPFIEEYVKSNN